jgi:hypothetical protein
MIGALGAPAVSGISGANLAAILLTILGLCLPWILSAFTAAVVARRQAALTNKFLRVLETTPSSASNSASLPAFIYSKRNELAELHLLELVLQPRSHLARQLGLAREVLREIEYQKLPANTTSPLDRLNNSERRLLSWRTDNYECRHIRKSYSGEDTPFVTLRSDSHLNIIDNTYWCKYCLVSIRQRTQVPVIVK